VALFARLAIRKSHYPHDQEVKQKTNGPAPFHHPRVGPLKLNYRVFALPDTKQTMIAYYAEPGRYSEDGLRLLSSLVHSP
jgi:hypothetical protein